MGDVFSSHVQRNNRSYQGENSQWHTLDRQFVCECSNRMISYILWSTAVCCLSLCLVSCVLFLNAVKRRAGASLVIYGAFVTSKETSQPKTTSDAYVIQWKVAL